MDASHAPVGGGSTPSANDVELGAPARWDASPRAASIPRFGHALDSWSSLVERRGAYRNLWFRLPPLTRNLVRLAAGKRAPLWGNLQRLRPFSDNYGSDRGVPVDRVYIEEFLAEHAGDIKGRLLEVGTSEYTERFGTRRVSQSDIVDIRRENARATLVADLCEPGSLPKDRFDCVILTQTLQFLRDPANAMANIWQSLAPGGVLLLTVPTISRVDPVEHDYWRFTPLGLQALLEDHWPSTTIEIRVHGNLTTALAALLGLAAHEIRSERVSPQDDFFPLIVSARATKPALQ